VLEYDADNSDFHSSEMLRCVDVYRRIGTANLLHLHGPLTALPLIQDA